MFETMKRRWSGEPGGEAPTTREVTPPPVYTDQSAARLDAVRRELTQTRARLADADARWRTLKARGDDPEIEQACADLRPRLLDLRQQVTRLEAEERTLEARVRDTAHRAAQYAALVTDTTTRFQPLFDAVARLTPEAIADAYRTSRELDRMASDLLARSGDRTFRRPACDPFRALREALTEAGRVLDRQRVLFLAAGGDAGATTKTAAS